MFRKELAYEMFSYSGRVCDEVGRVDKELSEAFVEDWREHYLREDA